MSDSRPARRLPDPKECQRLAEQMLSYAKKAGADGAEVLVRDGTELELKVRLDEPAGLPSRDEMARDVPALDLWDDATLSLDVAEGIRRARVAEDAARKLDARVTNSDGASFGRSVGAAAFATSAGFSGSNRGT